MFNSDSHLLFKPPKAYLYENESSLTSGIAENSSSDVSSSISNAVMDELMLRGPSVLVNLIF